MKRILLAAVLLILFADASGAMAFVSAEPCTSLSEAERDSACPPLCVRCACCGQPVVPILGFVLGSVRAIEANPPADEAVPQVGSPHDILHVPK